MARIRQFAKDMGLSYNQAKNLVYKGRKLRDGGSSVLESTMNKVKPIKAKLGKVKKPEDYDQSVVDIALKLEKDGKLVSAIEKVRERQKKTAKLLQDPDSQSVRRQMIKKSKGGGFPDLTGDNKVTQADILKGRGVPGFSRGGGLAIQGLGFKGVR